jgi:hypothetical protein
MVIYNPFAHQKEVIRIAMLNTFLMVLFGASILPFLTSVQGLYLSVLAISLFAMLKQAGGLVQPLLKHVKMFHLVVVLFVFDVFEVALTVALMYDPERVAFLYASMVAIQAAIATAFWIKFDTLVAKMYVDDFEDFRIKESFLTSLAAFVGVGLTSLMTWLFATSQNAYIVWHSIVIGVVFLVYQLIFLRMIKRQFH